MATVGPKLGQWVWSGELGCPSTGRNLPGLPALGPIPRLGQMAFSERAHPAAWPLREHRGAET